MTARRDDLDGRLNDEIQFHLDQQIAKNIREGMSAEEARRAAMIKFGGVERTREYTRDQFRFARVHEFIRDVQIAIRSWKRSRGAALVAILTLAIGIGANTAMFSVLRAIVLNPLPYPEPDRMVSIWDFSDKSPHNEVSYANFADWKAQQTSFASLGLYRWWTSNITGDQEPERVQGFQLTAEAIDVFGLRPHLGRWFTRDENEPGKDKVVLLSYGLWHRRFGAEQAVLGKTIVINDVKREVIGVMPPVMNLPQGAEVVVPLRLEEAITTNRRGHMFYALGRLKPGVTLDDANAEIATITARLAQAYPETNKGLSARVYPLVSDVSTSYSNGVWLLMASVGFVLLIACANLANILLAQEPARIREIAVRASLGATRGRILRQLLAESVALSITGGCVGAATAMVAIHLLRNAAPTDVLISVPGLTNLSVDLPVLAFTSVLSVITGLIFGLLPALRASMVDTTTALRGSQRSMGATGGHRLRRLLVASEVALALILLAGSGSTLRAFTRMASMETGFDAHNVLTMGISLPYARYNADGLVGFYDTLLRNAKAIPGVVNVGLTSHIPLAPGNASNGLIFEGKEVSDQDPEAHYRIASAGYFETMGARLLTGRSFAQADTAQTPKVMVVNEAFAKRFYPKGDPIGHRLRFSGPPDQNPWREIIGVVANFRHEITRAPEPETYVPYTQEAESTLFVVARTRGDALGMLPAFRAAVSAIDPRQPIWAIKTLDEIKERSMAGFRALVGFITAFGAIALFLSAVGIFGVVSFLVSARTQEIGLRMALGARSADVVRLIVGQSATALVIGLLIGGIGALGMGGLLARAFPDMTSTDPTALMLTVVVLAVVAIIATWLPARRAAAVAPSEALRAD